MAEQMNSKNSEFKTISYQLGNAILNVKSIEGLLNFPKKIIELRKEVLLRRKKKELHGKYEEFLKTYAKDQILFEIYKKFDIQGLIDFLNWYPQSNTDKAEMLLCNAKYAEIQDLKAKNTLTLLALKYDKSEKTLRACAWVAWHEKKIEKLKDIISLMREQGTILDSKVFFDIANTFESKFSNIKKNPKVSNVKKTDGILNLSYNEEGFAKEILEYYYLEGDKKLIAKIKQQAKSIEKVELAYIFVKVAKVLSQEAVYLEAEFCEQALKISQHEKILRASLWAFQRNKKFDKTALVISKLLPILESSIKDKDKELLEKIYKSPAYSLLIENLIVKQPIKEIVTVKKRIAYILHNSFPYSSGGYATRAVGVADGLRNHGYEVVVINRPGFPLDIKPELTESDVSESEIISGFEYVRTLYPLRKGLTAYEYMLKAADALQRRFEEYKPEVVIAASNHITAIPALIAAKRLGIPFIYEVRGFWEITRVSREPEFEKTSSFAVQVALETIAANYASYVYTLTNPMISELVKRGVSKEKIGLIPNSCNPEDFTPKTRNKSLARKLHIPANIPVIGYIGTFVQYEGLDDLAEACGFLKQKGIKFRLLLVGNENASGLDRGPITQKILDLAEQFDFTDWLIMPGRVPHEEVEAYYSLIDIAPFPRKPQPVCEMVSPMKPLEASAMKKAIIVSSVQALTEMIVDGKTGLVFKKGDTQDLALKIEALLENKKLREQLGENGRAWVENERTWLKTTNVITDVLHKLTLGIK